jgi:molybdopterin-guanine dinucleotide biosynthesis protein A
LEPFGISNLLEQVLSRLSLFKSEIILVADAGRKSGDMANIPKVRLVRDIYPERGPLGGIYTGLAASTTAYNLVTACDMPFLNVELLRYMVQLAPSFDMVVPRQGKLFEPLHAIYSRTCLTTIENMLKKGQSETFKLLELMRVRYVEVEEIERFDPKQLSFFNINTEADLRKAKELIINCEP